MHLPRKLTQPVPGSHTALGDKGGEGFSRSPYARRAFRLTLSAASSPSAARCTRM